MADFPMHASNRHSRVGADLPLSVEGQEGKTLNDALVGDGGDGAVFRLEVASEHLIRSALIPTWLDVVVYVVVGGVFEAGEGTSR